MTDLKQPSIVELRERLGNLRGAIEEREFLKCQSVPEGIPRGVICEIIGSARTEWTLSLLKENPSLNLNIA